MDRCKVMENVIRLPNRFVATCHLRNVTRSLCLGFGVGHVLIDMFTCAKKNFSALLLDGWRKKWRGDASEDKLNETATFQNNI